MKDITVFSRVTFRDKVFFSRQLAVMISAGLTIDNAINLLKLQTKNVAFKNALNQIYDDITRGETLSSALAKFPKIFDQFFVAVVKSGESTGKLDFVLNHLADHMELVQTFTGKIKSALAYPIFIVVAMIGVIILMMVQVIPALKDVFSEAGAQLPWVTRALIATSDFMVGYWWLCIIILVVLVASVYSFLRFTRTGRLWWDVIKLKTPIISYVSYDSYMARFTRTMAMLIQSGIPIIEAIKITIAVVNNRVFGRILENTTTQVERGVPMSVPLMREKDIPVLVSQMIMIGEQTGKMEMLLNKLAEYYDEATDRKIKTISSMIEPVTILIVGAGVFFVLYAIFLPIYSLANVIK